MVLKAFLRIQMVRTGVKGALEQSGPGLNSNPIDILTKAIRIKPFFHAKVDRVRLPANGQPFHSLRIALVLEHGKAIQRVKTVGEWFQIAKAGHFG